MAHINVLELCTVLLALKHFLPCLQGQHVLVKKLHSCRSTWLFTFWATHVPGILAPAPAGCGADMAEMEPGRSLKHKLSSDFLPVRRRCDAGSWIRWPTHGQTHCIMLPPAQPDLSSINQSEASGAVTNFNSSTVAIQTLDSRVIQLLAKATPNHRGFCLRRTGRYSILTPGWSLKLLHCWLEPQPSELMNYRLIQLTLVCTWILDSLKHVWDPTFGWWIYHPGDPQQSC